MDIAGQMPRTVEVPVPPEFQAQEAAQKQVQNLGAPDVSPKQIQEAEQALAEHEAAQAPQPVAPPPLPPPPDDSELEAAQEADRKSHLTAGLELAGRQLVGGITRTEVGQGIGAAPSRVPVAMERAKSRREQAAAVLARQRQERMDQATLDENKSQAELRTAQAAHLLAEKKKGAGDLQELESYKAVMSKRYPQSVDLINGVTTMKAAQDLQNALEGDLTRASNERVGDKAAYRSESFRREDKALDKADKAAEDIPPGYEVPPDAHPGAESRKKFSGLVASAEKMKGLTRQMRAALKGTNGLTRTLDPKTVTALKQLGTMISIEGKNVAGLGALSGPDMALMDAIAADPTSIRTNLTVDLPRMLDQLDAWGDNSVAAESKTTGIRKKAGATKAGKVFRDKKTGELVEVE